MTLNAADDGTDRVLAAATAGAVAPDDHGDDLEPPLVRAAPQPPPPAPNSQAAGPTVDPGQARLIDGAASAVATRALFVPEIPGGPESWSLTDGLSSDDVAPEPHTEPTLPETRHASDEHPPAALDPLHSASAVTHSRLKGLLAAGVAALLV